MNWHEVIDERSYELHQVVAGILRDHPEKLELALEWMERFLEDPEYSVTAKEALQEWMDLIQERGLVGVLAKLTERSEDATRMRQSSPFASIMPQEERVRIFQKYESLRPRAHPAGV